MVLDRRIELLVGLPQRALQAPSPPRLFSSVAGLVTRAQPDLHWCRHPDSNRDAFQPSTSSWWVDQFPYGGEVLQVTAASGTVTVPV